MTLRPMLRDDLDDDNVRCTIADHVSGGGSTGTRKRRRDPVVKLSVRIPRGASYQNLRRHLFTLAERHDAYKREDESCIWYSLPVVDTSDLEALLYFTLLSSAMSMEREIVQAVRDRWCSKDLPITQIDEVEVERDSLKRVWAHHWDAGTSPSSFEYVEEVSQSDATTVVDEEEIMRESVVDKTKTNVKFHLCHIDGSVKGTEHDTTGNHFPLPGDWRLLFDAYTDCDRVLISIAPAPGEEGTAPPESDGRSPVVVHVYFDPSSPDCGEHKMSCLRGATLVRKNVFAVTVWKREAPLFVKKLAERHNKVVLSWSRIP